MLSKEEKEKRNINQASSFIQSFLVIVLWEWKTERMKEKNVKFSPRLVYSVLGFQNALLTK